MGFVVDKVALGQALQNTSVFLANYLTNYSTLMRHHPGLV
jgi:hypothetical protein